MPNQSPRDTAPPEHDLPFDPTHGYGLERLLTVGAPEGPGDFDEFWRGQYEAALRIDPAPALGPPEAEVAGLVVRPVRYTSAGGRRIGGWLTTPADGPVTQGCVAAHGYGGRAEPSYGQPPAGAATLWPCLRGLGARSLFPDLPAEAAGHVLAGVESRESYILGGCVADVWCAATALRRLVPESARRLTYLGTSFGGGIGALALPWDGRFDAAALTVPTFGNHPLRATLTCTGSGASVQRRYAQDPSVLDVLAYFDAATAATRIRIPVHVGAALFDPSVPPAGQFAVYNALGGPKELQVLRTGHFEHPGEAAETAGLVRLQRDWLGSAAWST